MNTSRFVPSRLGIRYTVLRVCMMVVPVISLAGQTIEPPIAFEVSSVKLNTSGRGGSRTRTTAGQREMQNVTLKMCIEMAYDVDDYSLSGPTWLGSVRLDIVAKPAGSPNQFQRMMQTLLSERLKLAVHRESKTISGYALVIAAGGPKIKPVVEAQSTGKSSPGMIVGESVSVEWLADQLSSRMRCPIQDMTKLSGVFNIALTWTPDVPLPAGAAPGADSDVVRDGPSLFSALQEQLGLKLEGRRTPVQILIVDHVEKVPTEN
jgi:uncharacterized protein (TIGR03435 family)